MNQQFLEPLEAGAIWIHGVLDVPVSGANSGPLVMSGDWMLEMVHFEAQSHTIGLFLAAFGLVNFDLPEFATAGRATFVGFSAPGNPPAEWLKGSIAVDMGNAPLAGSPEELVRHFARPLTYKSLEASPEASALARAARRRICETYHADIPISEIAAGLNVSHAHLTRQFRRDFGFTPIGYRHQLRVSEATGRLFRGDNILDVGQDVGFNDTSRFYHGFRKITGVSPGKCRP